MNNRRVQFSVSGWTQSQSQILADQNFPEKFKEVTPRRAVHQIIKRLKSHYSGKTLETTTPYLRRRSRFAFTQKLLSYIDCADSAQSVRQPHLDWYESCKMYSESFISVKVFSLVLDYWKAGRLLFFPHYLPLCSPASTSSLSLCIQ